MTGGKIKYLGIFLIVSVFVCNFVCENLSIIFYMKFHE